MCGKPLCRLCIIMQVAKESSWPIGYSYEGAEVRGSEVGSRWSWRFPFLIFGEGSDGWTERKSLTERRLEFIASASQWEVREVKEVNGYWCEMASIVLKFGVGNVRFS